MRVTEDERDDLIREYFCIDKSINRLYNRLKQLEYRHRSQTYHTRIEPTNERLRTTCFHLEEEVCTYLDARVLIEKRLDKVEKKKRYFNDYLARIPPEDLDCLRKRYLIDSSVTVNEKLKIDLCEELQEIEDALCYMDGRTPENRIKVADNKNLSFEEMLNVLGV